MKIKIYLTSILLFTLQILMGQAGYIPLDLSGFNADCIVESTNEISGTSPIDKDGWAFFSSEIQNQGSFPSDKLPINTAMGIRYTLAPENENNTLNLQPKLNTKGRLTLSSSIRTSELWVLGTSANGSNSILVTINYQDGSTSSNEIEFPDWYQNSSDGVSVYGLGRIRVSGDYDIDERLRFSLFDRMIQTDSTKNITSVDVEHSDGSGYLSLFALSAFDISTTRSNDNTFYLISDSHLDTQWNWDLEQTIGEYIPKTLDDNFALFEKYPHFQFNFEAAIHYMWMKEYYPQKWEKLKEYVDQGRWNISGASVNANDVMVPSAESLIRNFLYGQTFYKKEFGRKGGSDFMLPDCFGFPYSLPTLAKHSGIIGFHTAKLAWGSAYDYNQLFTFGRWKGIDGSEILALLKPGPYDSHEEFRKNLSYDSDALNKCIANKTTLGISSTFRYVGPRSDRGGGLDDETAGWLEKSITSNGPVKVKLTSPDSLFKSITAEQNENLPVWNNELPMRTHGVGCYSSKSILKYWNRKNELLAGATEKTSVVSDWIGGLHYPSAEISEAWIRLLWHQFHDDLTGTSIPKSYSYGYNDAILNQLNLSKTLINSVGAITKTLNTNTIGEPVVVFNPLSIPRTDVVEATMKMSTKPTSLQITDKDGNLLESQILNYNKSTGNLSFLFLATVPSMGYAVFDVQSSTSVPISDPTLLVSAKNIENMIYKVSLNSKGDVSSIYDKEQQKELLSAPIRMALLKNTSKAWPSWEITAETDLTAPYAYVDENVSITIAEEGPLRVALKISRTKEGSEYIQYIRLTSQGSTDRIDFKNEVNWQTKGTLLKAVFPLTATNDSASFDLSIGAIKRANSSSEMYEYAAHQWADLTHSTNNWGVSFLNDCKYGWDKPNNHTLRLSLIHTPEVGGNYTYQRYQDLGLNKFMYSFYRHLDSWNESTQWEAEKVNQPLLAFQAPKHEGELGSEFAFAQLSTEKVAIKAMKKAEISDEIIIRVYELVGKSHSNVKLSLPAEIISATEVNGIEENIGMVAFEGNAINFDIQPFQPKSFALKLSNPKASLSANNPSSEKIELVYNIDVMSYDHKRNDGEFGNTGFSYPAELLRDTIVADGIHFALGDRSDSKLNAIRCEGQTIKLPPTNTENKKLYILAASTDPAGTSTVFKTNNQENSLQIDYFGGSIGQWDTQFAQGYYRPGNVAFTSTHKHNTTNLKNELYQFLYLFKYAIPVNEQTKTLTLPDNPNVIVFSASLSDNTNDDIQALTPVSNLPRFEDIENVINEAETCNDKISSFVVTVSGQTNDAENATMAIDNNPFTKWCDNQSNPKWLQLEFEEEMKICQWKVLHAAIENEGYITSSFSLQKYVKGSWIDVDEVENNTNNKTSRVVAPFVAKKIRLKITKAEQNSNSAARIYDFEVFGTKKSTGAEKFKTSQNLSVFPNPVGKGQEITVKTSEKGDLKIYSLQGQILHQQATSGIARFSSTLIAKGSYLVKFTSESGFKCQKLIIN